MSFSSILLSTAALAFLPSSSLSAAPTGSEGRRPSVETASSDAFQQERGQERGQERKKRKQTNGRQQGTKKKPQGVQGKRQEGKKPAARPAKGAQEGQGKKGKRLKDLKPRKAPQGARSQKRTERPQGNRGLAAQPGGARGAATPDPMDQTLAAFEAKALQGQAGDTDFQQLAQTLNRLTTAEGTKGARDGQRLQRTVEDLRLRSKQTGLAAEDLAVLREQWVDTRLDRALESLASNAATRGLTRADFAQVSDLLGRRARAAKALDPKAVKAQRRLQAEVDRLAERSATTRLAAQDLSSLRSELGQARLTRALSDLERRSMKRSASAADVQRVTDQIDDQEAGPRVDPNLYQKLRQAISRLEGRALRGEVSSEEFAALREGLTRRARNAASK